MAFQYISYQHDASLTNWRIRYRNFGGTDDRSETPNIFRVNYTVQTGVVRIINYGERYFFVEVSIQDITFPDFNIPNKCYKIFRVSPLFKTITKLSPQSIVLRGIVFSELITSKRSFSKFE